MTHIRVVLFDVGGTLVQEDEPSVHWPPRPTRHATTVVRRLASKYSIGIVSNIPARLNESIQKVIQSAGFDMSLFSAVVTSSEVGVRKPDSRIFKVALKKLNATSGESVMVGNDLQADICGAKRAGIRAILIGSSAVEERTPRQCTPDYVIDDLDSLEFALRKLEGRSQAT